MTTDNSSPVGAALCSTVGAEVPPNIQKQNHKNTGLNLNSTQLKLIYS